VIWIAVAFCVLAVAGSGWYAGVRGLATWRAFRHTSGRAGDALGRLAARAAEAEGHAIRVSAGSERLSASVERLRRSLAELAAIRAAAAEPQALLAALRGAVPRK